MKKEARITSKEQITVPHEIRRGLGIQPVMRCSCRKTAVGFACGPEAPRVRLKDIAASVAPAFVAAGGPSCDRPGTWTANEHRQLLGSE